MGARTVAEIAAATDTPIETVLRLLEKSAYEGIRHGEGWRLSPNLHPELLAALRTLAEWTP